MSIASTQEIIADIKAGKMVILMDAEDRENEGDLLMAAQFVTAEHINFMTKYARGLVCLSLTGDIVDRLQLPMMTGQNGTRYGTNFTVSIEAAQGVTTGISAQDRALTIQTAVAPTAKSTDLVQPGHIFPLRAQEGGVLVRAGHTEAGCDLTTLAGLTSAAVICEIMNDDGTMARMPELIEFAKKHDLKIGTIADLIHYRSQNESLIDKLGETQVETDWGTFRQVVFADRLTGETHIALVKGHPEPDREVLVRVHEPFSAMDFILPDLNHAWSLPKVLKRINESECGAAILLHRTEDGKALRMRALPDNEYPGTKWDSKTYGIGAQIIRNLNIGKMRLMATPSSITGLIGFGLEVVGFE